MMHSRNPFNGFRAALLPLTLIASLTQAASGDIIVQYDLSTASGGNDTSSAASASSPSVTPKDYVANIGTISGSSNTHFINGGLAEGTIAQAIANNWSGEFGVTVDVGMLNLESLTYTARTDNKEADDTFTFEVRSSLDGYSTALDTLVRQDTLPDNVDVTIDLTGAAFQGLTGSVDFRIYVATSHGEGVGMAPTNERARIVPNVTLNGTITGGAPELQLIVDRDTGEISIVNPGGASLDFIAYEITSGFGSLDASNWTSIADTYDADGSPGPTISSDNWTKLTGGNPEAPKNGDLSEIDFQSAAGATLGAGASISLGVGSWIATDNENLSFTYALTDGTEVDGQVSFVGNNNGDADVPFAEGDLDTDGDIDTDDWVVFRTNFGGQYLGDSAAQAYRRGDLNGDLDVDPFDFVEFQALFDAANGEGALAAVIAGVPEPTSLAVFAALGIGLSLVRRRAALALAAFALAVGLAPSAHAQFSENFNGLSAGSAPAQLPGWSFFDLGDITNDTNWQITNDATSGSNFGSLHLSQTSTAPDLLAGQGGNIGGALAIANGSDVSAADMIDFDFAFGGFGDDSGGSIDSKLIFGFRDIESFFSLSMVAGGSGGGSTQVTISEVSLVDDVLTRTDFLNQGGFSAGFSTSPTVLHGRVIHDSESGSVSVNISEGGTTVYSAFISDEAFKADGDVGFGMNNDAGSFDNLLVQEFPRLTLQIDPVDGDMQIVNNAAMPIDLDLYEITSFDSEGAGLNLLSPAGWSSLEAQNLPGFTAGNGSGNGWEAGDASNANTLVEANLSGGGSTFAVGNSIYLGEAAADGVTDGISWRYHAPGAGSVFVTGKVEYVNIDAPAGLPGDYNDDGIVDVADYTVWRDNLGTNFDLAGNGDETGGSIGVVDIADYLLWRTNFGETSAAAASVAAPEPRGLILMLLGGLAMLIQSRFRKAAVATAAVAIAVGVGAPATAIEFDRIYEFGEEENITSGPVTTTFDSPSPFVDLAGVNGPTYVSAADRPGAVAEGSTTGISFDGVDDYLQGFRFGNPETSRGAIGWDEFTTGQSDLGGAKNYTGIRNRGMQVWVKPAGAGSGPQQSVMADTNQFGILISDDSDGNPTWLLQSNDAVFDSGVEVDFDAWTHVSVVRQFGAGTVLYIDGVAVTRTSSGYTGSDTSRLVFGSNTAGDEINFSGGTTDYFRGVLDQAELFTWGESNEGPGGEPAADFGDFNFARDNGFARLPFAAGGLSGVAGDINNDNTLDQLDINAFLAGWQNSNFIEFATNTNSDAPVGDLASFSKGDLNFDGATNISDAILMHLALVNSGAGGLNFDLLATPEPGAAALLGVMLGGLSLARRRQG